MLIRFISAMPSRCVQLDLLREGSLLLDGENQKDSTSSASGLASDLPSDFKHRRSSSKWNEEFSPTSSTVTESTQAGELISGSKHPIVCSHFHF